MDFKALMTSQIQKSKTPASKSSTSNEPAPSKYLRRADLESARQREYQAEQARLEEEREQRAAKKRKLEDDEAARAAEREDKRKRMAEESRRRREEEEREAERRRRRRLGLPEPSESGETDGDDSTAQQQQQKQLLLLQADVPDDELRQKLRDLDEPAALFGEDHGARLRRYHRLAAAPTLSDGPIPTTLAPLADDAAMRIPDPLPAETDAAHALLPRQIAAYLTLLLREWRATLASRPAEVARSQSGKQAAETLALVTRDLTPLFRRLEATDSSSLSSSSSHGDANATATATPLPPTLLRPLASILALMQARRYVAANDAYLTLSIGKSAWPIGVTMVGIHERAARQKLHEHGDGKDREAHILSDESTRKFLQSVKRCLTYAQVRWPPDDLGQLMG